MEINPYLDQGEAKENNPCDELPEGPERDNCAKKHTEGAQGTKMGLVWWVVWYISMVLALPSSGLSPFPKILLISFDGFRHDLIDPNLVPHIHKWATEGTWYKNGVKSQYVTYTAPNHLSIASGLYEESHGIVSNYFYDPDTNRKFDYFNMTKKPDIVNASMDTSWFNADPIWLTNQRADKGRRSASWYWPMGEVKYPQAPHVATHAVQWTDYRNLTQWMNDCDFVLKFFTDEQTPYNFVAWYVEEPDHTLHLNGFNNGALNKKLEELDKLFEYLLKRMEAVGLKDMVNVILTSDHGHSEVLDEDHVFCISDHINMTSGFEAGDHMIYPKDEEHAIEIFNNLTKAAESGKYKVKITWKKDFPDKFHYRNNNRIGRILLEAEIGSALSFNCKQKVLEETYGRNGKVKFNSSTHGMDPNEPDMHGILVMNGPAFEKSIQIQEIPENIDLYEFMCEILKVKPSPNNGTRQSVVFDALLSQKEKMAKSFGKKDEVVDETDLTKQGQNKPKQIHPYLDVVTNSMSFLFILAPAMLIVTLFLCYGCRHTVCKVNDVSSNFLKSYFLRFLNHAIAALFMTHLEIYDIHL
ncbi:hypothetical protein WR25_15716 isoform C [Diploscapter pachys]|uniref:Uncharacterized protein n=1 Tax=Diploscapter pachys TaxID=2018661 RepID=A0A2A2J3V9_9BILA|nr:hypothetical protein WR25_15716 isoform C [Diploscapter pachys]